MSINFYGPKLPCAEIDMGRFCYYGNPYETTIQQQHGPKFVMCLLCQCLNHYLKMQLLMVRIMRLSFKSLFQSMINTETWDKLKNILDQIASAAECSDGTKLPVKQFLGVLHNQLLTDLIASRSSMYKWNVENTENNLTEANQNVLF